VEENSVKEKETMLYNKELKKVKQDVDCLECPDYDKQEKRCKGIGKTCFGYDPITQTCIDPITGMAFKVEDDR